MDVLIHIDDTTKEQLQNHATRAGQTFDDYVAALLKECAIHPPKEVPLVDDEAALLVEYHALIDLKRQRPLTADEKVRLQDVERDLDDFDDASPGAEYMRSQADMVRATLDQLLATVSALPSAKL